MFYRLDRDEITKKDGRKKRRRGQDREPNRRKFFFYLFNVEILGTPCPDPPPSYTLTKVQKEAENMELNVP